MKEGRKGDRGAYRLEELDSTEIAQFLSGERLKLFHIRGGIYEVGEEVD